MNDNTRQSLVALCEQIQNFADSVSSVAGTDASGKLIMASQEVIDRLNKDETIP